MQLQADLLGVPVEVAAEPQATAMGVACLAGLAVGVWADAEELAGRWACGSRFEPRLRPDEANALQRDWRRAVTRALLE
jgi:glycerol kinase